MVPGKSSFEEHAILIVGGPRKKQACAVVLPRWSAFRPRTDENDWCRHIFRESNKANRGHTCSNCVDGQRVILVLELQWTASDLHDKIAWHGRHIVLSR